jgi:2-polyprenyl-3-methyl-5-hydroxy-6-metoxy-1,4-benzoquinol methylase
MTSPAPPHCPACESDAISPAAVEKFDGCFFRIARCRRCGALFTSYRETDRNVDYREFDEEAFNRKYLPILQGTRTHDRHENYLEITAVVKKYLPSGRLLDVGCHGGWLLSYLKSVNLWELYGLEPSPFLARLTSERLGIKVYNEVLGTGVLENGRFDFVTLTDVLEHLMDPRGALRTVRDSLKAGGSVLIKVPNADFIVWKYRLRGLLGFLFESEDIFDAKEHYVLFSRKALKVLLSANGFRILDMRVPKPIQPRGSGRLTRTARAVVYHLARAGILPGQDLLVVARKLS